MIRLLENEMERKPARVLLVENCARGMSPTLGQLAWNAGKRFLINFSATLGDALIRLEEDRFDAVLLSFDLPDSGGLDALQLVRARVGAVPVVALTGEGDERAQAQAREAGAVEVFPGLNPDTEVIVGFLDQLVHSTTHLASRESEEPTAQPAFSPRFAPLTSTTQEPRPRPDTTEPAETITPPVVSHNIPGASPAHPVAEEPQYQTAQEPPEERPAPAPSATAGQPPPARPVEAPLPATAGSGDRWEEELPEPLMDLVEPESAAALEERLVAVESYQQDIAQRFLDIETDAEGRREQIETLLRRLDAVGTKLAAEKTLAAKLAAVVARQEELAAEVARLHARLEETANAAAVDALRQSARKLDDAQAEQDQRLAACERTLADNGGGERIETPARHQAELAETVAQLRSRADNCAAGVRGKLAELARAVDEIAERTAAQPQTIAARQPAERSPTTMPPTPAADEAGESPVDDAGEMTMSEATMNKETFAESIGDMLRNTLGSDTAFLETAARYLEPASGEPNLWEVANLIGNYYNDHDVSADVREECRGIIDEIRDFQGQLALDSDRPTTVVFGTSGWRGVIGEDFNLPNVHKVVRGIKEMMRTPAFLETNGYRSFDEVQKHGIVVFRDNRYLGDTFMDAAMKELAAGGIRIHCAGECPTGVGSALVTELDAAGSINFTPSHNPMDYAGVKFNPADGGPADPSLTSIIEEMANAYMLPGTPFEPAIADYAALREDVDAKRIFADFVLNKSKVFDLPALRDWLKSIKHDLALAVDFMHGSARGYVQAVLGEEAVKELTDAGALVLLNEETDYSFHGVKPEPSAKNQAPLIAKLKQMNRRYALAVALDPDADRIRFADAENDIDMNRFGGISYAALLQRGLDGGIATTAPSSDFPLEIAKREGKEYFELAVGFKNFRPLLRADKVLVAFEESDGISFLGHTLEKCALAGFLMALETMKATGENLGAQYARLREKYGYFYPNKAGAEVKGVGVEEWQAYKRAVVEALQHKLFKAGDSVEIAGEARTVAEINIIDGLKLIFADKSWILLRPSGTEPKFRYYFELASETPIGDVEKRMQDYEDAATRILQQAREMVDAKA